MSWSVCAAPYAVVSEDTMAPMSNPDPMPVEVIKALALDGVLLDGVLLEELGEMTELIGLRPRYIAQFIGNFLPDLSKPRTKNSQTSRAQARLSTMTPEIPTLRARAANSLAGNSAMTSPFAGLTCWMSLSSESGATRN